MLLLQFGFELRCRPHGLAAALLEGTSNWRTALGARQLRWLKRRPNGSRTRFHSCTEAAMPERRRAGRLVAGIVAGGVIVAAVGIAIKFGYLAAPRAGSGSAGSSVAVTEKSP